MRNLIGITEAMKIGFIKVTLILASFINVLVEDGENRQLSVWKRMGLLLKVKRIS